MKQSLRRKLGAAAWCVCLLALAGWIRREPAVSQLAKDLWQYASGRQTKVMLRSESSMLAAVGDPIYVEHEGRFRQVGEIISLAGVADRQRPAYTKEAEALFYADAPPLHAKMVLKVHRTPDSLEWILATLLPPEKKTQIAGELKQAFAAHQAEILAELQPVVEAGLKEAVGVAQEEFTAAVQRHRADIRQIGQRYQRELVDQELTELFEQQVWPIVRRHAEPVAEDVGMEIWQRVSFWRFAWRYAYDKTPLSRESLTKQEWSRFVDEEALPVLEKHTPQIVAMQQRILADVAKNEQVRASLQKNAIRIVDDPAIRKLMGEILREVFVESPRLKQVFQKHWRGERFQRALTLAAQRADPVVRRIGELIVGTRADGATPEFAAMLRNQILAKDRRWFVLESAGNNAMAAPASTAQSRMTPSRMTALPVLPGEPAAANPFLSPRKN